MEGRNQSTAAAAMITVRCALAEVKPPVSAPLETASGARVKHRERASPVPGSGKDPGDEGNASSPGNPP